jgi:hypothetical protein
MGYREGGRMGCLMKEKIQGLAERKAFILSGCGVAQGAVWL